MKAAAAALFLPGDRYPVTRAEYEADMLAIRSEHRVLVGELEAVLEKLSMAYARDAKRKARQLQEDTDQQTLQLAASPRDRKAELRRAVAGAKGIIPMRGPAPGPPPDDGDEP